MLACMEYTAPLLNSVLSAEVRGFCVLVMEYLSDACGVNRGDGKNTGGPDRTTIWGLQRPPLDGQQTVLRCAADTSFDELAPTLVPFFVTNARETVRVSVDPANSALVAALAELEGVAVVTESEAEFEAVAASEALFNVVRPEALADNNNTASLEQFPMVGQFVSLYLPMGHIKVGCIGSCSVLCGSKATRSLLPSYYSSRRALQAYTEPLSHLTFPTEHHGR